MFAFLRRHAVTIMVAMITAAVTAGGPAVAAAVADAINADKVDGRDAVGPKASADKRAGNLVATKPNGKLPNDIIAEAPNADRLDGLNSTDFLRNTGKAADADKLDGRNSDDFAPNVLGSGDVQSGIYAAFGNVYGSKLGGSVTYPTPLPAGMPSDKMHYVSGAPTADCPGAGDAAAGHLCLYQVENQGVTSPAVYPTSGDATGFAFYGYIIYDDALMWGRWTVRAP